MQTKKETSDQPPFSPSEETRRADPSEETLKIWASGKFATEQEASLAQQVLTLRATRELRSAEATLTAAQALVEKWRRANQWGDMRRAAELEAALGSSPADKPGRCEGRYPVPQTSPPRDEPFAVTYRCSLLDGHEGPHGAGSSPAAKEQK